MNRSKTCNNEDAQVLFCGDQKQSAILYCAILSLLNNLAPNERIALNIANIDNNKFNSQYFESFLQKFSLKEKISCYTVLEINPVDLATIDHRGDRHPALAKFIAIEKLSQQGIQKLIYLDSDILIRSSVIPLWQSPLESAALMACPDLFESENRSRLEGLLANNKLQEFKTPNFYFNSGVMVLDLDKWNQHRILKQTQKLVLNGFKSKSYVDQDLFNLVFASHYVKKLSPRWNWLRIIKGNYMYGTSIEELKTDCLPTDAISIVHYAGDIKPWHHTHCLFAEEYRELYTQKLGFPLSGTNSPIQQKFKLARYKFRKYKRSINTAKPGVGFRVLFVIHFLRLKSLASMTYHWLLIQFRH